MSSNLFQSGFGSGVTVFARYSFNATNGYGSTNTKVRKWVNNPIATDPSGILTVSNSATNGLIITANVKVRITISYTDISQVEMQFAIVKNGTQGTTGIQTVTAADVLSRSATPNLDNTPDVCCATDIAVAGDYYWGQTDGGAAASTASAQSGMFIIAEQIP